MAKLFPKQHRKRTRWVGGVMLGLTALTLTACGSKQYADPGQSSSARTSQTAHASSNLKDSSADNTSASQKSNASNQTETTQANRSDDLAHMDYQSGSSSVVQINNNQSTLQPSDWKENRVDYANLDHLNRTSAGNTGYLEGKNVANSSLRSSQTFKPTGYKQKFVNNQPILNRGHEIAYSLSKGISTSGQYEPKDQAGDQNNPKNLFSQTAFSNQKVQTIYESQVRNALKQGKKVIYQVQPVFNGNDLMAKGVHMQALSTDGSLNYNVYLYNVQPGMKFDYATGSSQVDRNMNVPTPAGAPSFNNDNNGKSQTTNSTPANTTKKHHYVRDAAVAGTAHHFIKKHYQKKYGSTVSNNHHTISKAVVGGVAIHEAHKHL